MYVCMYAYIYVYVYIETVVAEALQLSPELMAAMRVPPWLEESYPGSPAPSRIRRRLQLRSCSCRFCLNLVRVR